MTHNILVPLYNLGYYKCCRSKLINATLGTGKNSQRATVHPSIFYAIFPRLNRKWAGDTVEATAEQLKTLGLAAPEMPHSFCEVPIMINPEPDPLQARYVFDPSTGHYIVRLLEPRQALSVSAAGFRRITGISPRAV
ncbi:hypothetical protein GNF78_15285, partial [Clostridium perfringens]